MNKMAELYVITAKGGLVDGYMEAVKTNNSETMREIILTLKDLSAFGMASFCNHLSSFYNGEEKSAQLASLVQRMLPY